MRTILLRWLARLGPLMAVCAAGATTIPLAVSPVNVRLDPGTEYATVEVSNRGDAATGIEIDMRHVLWVDGREQNGPTKDFIVSPPSFRLQPGKNRLVRFKYSGPRGDMEGMYRMFIRQLPERSTGGEVSMVFNIGVPVFISPVTARPALALAGSSPAELRNTGNVSLNLGQIEGPGCSESTVAKLRQRLAPGQKLELQPAVSKCASGVQTERGLILLSTP